MTWLYSEGSQLTDYYVVHAGRRLDSAPSANVVAMPTKIAPLLVVSPGKHYKHIRSIWHTSRLIGDFVQKIAQICQNFVAMATRVGPTTFCMVSLNRPSPKTPSRPKHFLSICHTSRHIGDFVQVQILGSTFWRLRGLNQKSKKTVLYSATWRTDGQKMARFHRDTKEEAIWRSTVTDIQTDRHSESMTKNNRLLG